MSYPVFLRLIINFLEGRSDCPRKKNGINRLELALLIKRYITIQFTTVKQNNLVANARLPSSSSSF